MAKGATQSPEEQGETTGHNPQPALATVLRTVRSTVLRAARWMRKILRMMFPQWVRTVLAAFVWLAWMPFWIRTVSTYDSYGSAMLMGAAGLFAIISALYLPALSEDRPGPATAHPWRTIIATMLVTSTTGGVMLLWAGVGRFTLPIVFCVGALFVLAQVTPYRRRVLGLVRTWRMLRRR